MTLMRSDAERPRRDENRCGPRQSLDLIMKDARVHKNSLA